MKENDKYSEVDSSQNKSKVSDNRSAFSMQDSMYIDEYVGMMISDVLPDDEKTCSTKRFDDKLNNDNSKNAKNKTTKSKIKPSDINKNQQATFEEIVESVFITDDEIATSKSEDNSANAECLSDVVLNDIDSTKSLAPTAPTPGVTNVVKTALQKKTKKELKKKEPESEKVEKYSAKGSFSNKAHTANIHEGHRERMRLRHENDTSMQSFAEHELLEYLLFNSVYRRNTNPLAHRLLQEFGSLNNVLDASFSALRRFGLSESSIAQIKMILPIANRYMLEQHNRKIRGSSSYKVAEFFYTYYTNVDREIVYAILLNAYSEIITTINLGEGDELSVVTDVVKLINAVTDKRAAQVVLMHNHPSGNTLPSIADLFCTSNIMVHLSATKAIFTDHIIFGQMGEYFSFYQNGLIGILSERCCRFMGSRISSPNDKLVSGKFQGQGRLVNFDTVRAMQECMQDDDNYLSSLNIIHKYIVEKPNVNSIQNQPVIIQDEKTNVTNPYGSLKFPEDENFSDLNC